jgi:hypothetical protein
MEFGEHPTFCFADPMLWNVDARLEAVYRERLFGGSVRRVRRSFEAILRSRGTASVRN